MALSFFRSSVLFLILTSALIAGLKTYSSSEQLLLIEHVVLALFVAEITIRIILAGPRRFACDGANLFDLAVTSMCFLPLEVNCFAIFRLLTIIPGLNKIARMILKSLPSVGYVALLLGLHVYFYAIIGVSLFGNNDPLHFGSLAVTFVSLFQVVTLEGWVDLMATEVESLPIAAPLYFISFVIVGTILILNVLVSVMTNAFVEAKLESEIGMLKQSQSAGFDIITKELKDISRELKVKPKLGLIIGGRN